MKGVTVSFTSSGADDATVQITKGNDLRVTYGSRATTADVVDAFETTGPYLVSVAAATSTAWPSQTIAAPERTLAPLNRKQRRDRRFGRSR